MIFNKNDRFTDPHLSQKCNLLSTVYYYCFSGTKREQVCNGVELGHSQVHIHPEPWNVILCGNVIKI